MRAWTGHWAGRGGIGVWAAVFVLLGVMRCAGAETRGVFVALRGEPLAAGGRAAGPAAMEARWAAMQADQDRVIRKVGEVGGRVWKAHRLLVNGVFAEVPAEAVEELRAVEGVVAVTPERLFEPALASSVPTVGAHAAWTGTPGRTGRGVRIGIIDSGIDYLHADFGGSGSRAAYESNDRTWIEPGTFPTAVVAGGWDFVGDAYDASGGSSTPDPDPDPLDPASNGHGTHVAGIAAGRGVNRDGTTWKGGYGAAALTNAWRVAPGVAPEATLYALKVFGGGGKTSTRIVVDALEWAADPNGDGDPVDRLDVVNLSLGSPYGRGDGFDAEAWAIERLSGLGCVVVCSAGNGGNMVFRIDSPASTTAAIAVANTFAAGHSTGAMRIRAPASVAGLVPAVEGSFTPSLAGLGVVTGVLAAVEPALGCPPLSNPAMLNGKVALVDRGTCFFVDKVRAAQGAGAIAVVVVNNVEGPPVGMAGIGEIADIRIPAVMISRADGERLKPLLGQPGGVQVELSPDISIPFPELGDTVNEGSSRGLLWHTLRLKPDISAPGSSIDSAKAGRGADPSSETGTSMAAPHVAGAAALLREAHPFRSEPGWGAQEIKAALMNTALTPLRKADGSAFPASRAGAGRLDVASALGTRVIARSRDEPDAVSLSFGMVHADVLTLRTQVVEVLNLGRDAVELMVGASPAVDRPGIRLVPAVDRVSVPAGGRVPVTVVLEVDPGRMTLWRDRTSAERYLEQPHHGMPEAFGHLVFEGGGQKVRVPWHCAPRAVGRRTAPVAVAGAPSGDPVSMRLPGAGFNPHPRPLVGFFLLGFRQAGGGSQEVSSGLDIVAAGAASDFASAGTVEDSTLYFGVAMAGALPGPTRTFSDIEVEVDSDMNGIADVVLVNGNSGLVQAKSLSASESSNDGLVTVLNRRDGSALEAGRTWNALDPVREDAAAFANGVHVLAARGRQLGLSALRPSFRYRVVTRGLFNDETPWVRFDATGNVVDPTPHGLDGGPWQVDDRSARVTLRRGRAGLVGLSGFGRVPVLQLRLHNAPGAQASVTELDLANADVDFDGLVDAWELEHLGDLAGVPGGDRDGDGFRDDAEVLAGTDPRDPASHLALRVRAGGVPRLEWSSVAGRRYGLLRAERVEGPFELVQGGIAATPGTNSVALPVDAAGETRGFYRLRLE